MDLSGAGKCAGGGRPGGRRGSDCALGLCWQQCRQATYALQVFGANYWFRGGGWKRVEEKTNALFVEAASGSILNGLRCSQPY